MLEKTERQSITKAFCQFRSWLTTTKIPHTTSGYRFSIQAKNGETSEIGFDQGALVIDRHAVNHKNLDIAVAEFHRITSELGWGTPQPLVRPKAGRLKPGASVELVAFRHHELRRVGNPDPQKLASYKKTIDTVTDHIGRYNRASLDLLLLEKEDIRTYAQMLTCNYIGLYEVQDPGPAENEKRLYAYLLQRLRGYLVMSMRKNKSCSSREIERQIPEDEPTYERDFSVMSPSAKRAAYAKVAGDKTIQMSVRALARKKIQEI
jgi:hypothetical protein